MPSPKDIKNLLKATQGTKAGKAMDLEELLGTLPKGTKAQQLEAELMFKRLQEERDALYPKAKPATPTGKAALSEAKKTLAKKKPAPKVDAQKQALEDELARLQAGKEAFLEPSQVKERVYHGTGGDFSEFKYDPDKALGIWTSSDPEIASQYADIAGRSTKSQSVYPLHINLKNPASRKDYLDARNETQAESEKIGWGDHDRRHRQLLQSRGFDGVDLGGGVYVAFEPTQLKSAIGNQGTYDLADPDITKADGGVVHMAGGGKALKALRGAGKAADATQDVQSIVNAGKPLTAAERAMVDKMNAEYAASQPVTTSSKTGKVGSTKVRSTVHEPERMAFPGIYQRPDVIAAEAASRVADESPNLKKVFGVTRDDLYQMGKGRQGNLPGNLPGAAAKPKGSKAAAKVMTKKNEQRLIDTMAEAEKYPALVQGMDPWYIMDPVYQRMEQLLGREKAIEEYRKLNTLMGMASPGSEVLTEIPRGTAAYYLQNQGRFSDFVKYAGQPAGSRGADFPEDILNVPGHAYHKTAQATPMQQFLESGEMQMSSPKVPMYIEASGSPLSGFQTRTPVGDAHWSRAVGLADTRGAATRKGQPVIPGASVSNPEMTLLAPWWREAIAAPMGLESVPAQARAWGTFSGQTGVTTPIGAPKLELLADKIAETAHRLGVSIEKARDLVLTGETYAGKKDGGAVHMAGGNEPGESIGEMFKPKPLTIPSPLTDMVDSIRRQFNKEKRSMSKPGAVTDVLLRGPVAFAAGTPMDLIGMAGEGLDYLQTRIPGLRTNASVMDEPRSVVDKRQPDTNYEPRFKFGPQPKVHPSLPFDAFQYIQTNDPKLRAFINKRQKEINSGLQLPIVEEARMPYGTEDFQEKLRRAGLTTDEERPLLELGAGILAPFAASKALKYGKAGAQALAPTFSDILETQLQNVTAPMRMSIVPEGGTVGGKLKAPANDVGFYNPVEKAALNVQRKKGQGSAFVSDLKKQPGVNDERLAELGLSDLASRPNVTREEVLAAAEQNRIPLREVVSRERDAAAIDELEEEYESLAQQFEAVSGQGNPEEVMRISAAVDKNLAEQNRIKSLPEARFGPTTSPDYSLPGGQNYREIRVALPDNERKMSYEDWKKSGSSEPWSSRGVVGENFYNSTHHGDEPNVLFHLRVADHTDVEGKKGLLIDELQSDWHQKGRKTGYKGGTDVQSIERELNDLYSKRRDMRVEFDKHLALPENELITKEMQSRWNDVKAKINNLEEKRSAALSAVPDAPFKDNWYQLGLKRAIKEAADNGMERVYLTTGARQADRYDLSKQLSRVTYQDGVLNGYDSSGAMVLAKSVDPKDLPNYVGKDLASKMAENAAKDAEIRNKISVAKYNKASEAEIENLRSQLNDVKTDYAGLDLKVGGEGMKQYYDKTYKNFLDKYAKQFGATVGETKLRTGLQQDNWPSFRDWFEYHHPNGVNGRFANDFWTQGGSNKYLREFRNTLEDELERVYYIDITPKMRESAAKGQSYKDGGAVAMAEGGQLTFAKANQLLQQYVANMANDGAVHMAEGGAVDYESRFNEMLQKHVQGMAEGGEVNTYDSDPDVTDGGQFVQAPAFADGGAVKSIWTVN